MSDKILYTGGPNFNGLIGMPERPKRSDFESSEIGQQGFERSLIHYSEFVESIKSNAPDIVNPELIPLQIEECDLCDGCGWYEGGPTLKTTCNNCFGTGSVIHHYFSHVKVIPGDIFDLPVGYEFKKEVECCDSNTKYTSACDHCKHKEVVLRIVKTEVKEEFNLLKTLKDIESTYSGKHKKTLTEVIEYAEKMEKQGYYFDNGDWIKKSEKVDKKLTFCDKCGEMIVKGEVHECIVSQIDLVKTEVKEEGYMSGFKESISAHEFKKECLNEPEPEESQKEYDLPAAAVFQIQMIALADDEMVKKPGAAEAYRSIARHLLELFQRKK